MAQRRGRVTTDDHRDPAPTTEKQLDRVTIRFAGDSGDGMQLTGTQFTRNAAAFGNDISTLPRLPGRDPRPGRARCPGVSGFQLSFSSTEIHTPGDAPDVLVAMNPAALKANLGELPRGRRADRQRGRLHRPEPEEGRLRRQPADRRLAQAVERVQGAGLDAQQPGARRARPDQQAGRPDQELLRARADVLALRARHGRDAPLDRREVLEAARDRRGQQARAQGRLRLRRDDRDLPRALHRPAGQARRPAATGTSPATRRRPSGFVAASQLAEAAPSSTAPTRSRRPATSSTSSPATRTSASRPSRPRTRSPPSARRSARPTAGPWA